MANWQEAIKQEEGKIILEVGCGNGESLKEYAPSHKLVIGVDKMKHTSWKEIKRKNGNIEFLILDLYSGLPFKENCFDWVIANEVLGIKPKTGIPMDLILPEIKRALKKDGFIYISHPLKVVKPYQKDYVSKNEIRKALQAYGLNIEKEMKYFRNYEDLPFEKRLIYGLILRK